MKKTYEITRKSLIFGFSKAKSFWKYFLAMFIISIAIETFVNFPSDTLLDHELMSAFIPTSLTTVTSIIGFLLLVLGIILRTWWNYGLTTETLLINEKHTPRIKNLKKLKLKNIGKFFTTSLVQNFLSLVSFVPFLICCGLAFVATTGVSGIEAMMNGQIPMFNFTPLFWVMSLIALISLLGGIYISTRLMFTKLFFCENEKVEIIAPIKKSWEATKNKVNRTILYTAYIMLIYILIIIPAFVLLLVGSAMTISKTILISMGILVGLSTIIGLIIAVPTTWVSFTYFYHNVIKK